jgi:Flp pilus assembly protein TadD
LGCFENIYLEEKGIFIMAAIVKKFLMGCSVAIVFFILVELILMAFGVVPLYERTDPSVGFAGYSPLFTERTEPDGEQVFRTAHNKFSWFNLQSFPAIKAEGTTRIFCLGGSTTYGRPYNDLTSFCGWLRQFLPAADPSRRWEVINAGGVSYASYRVARLMKELAEYEPDLFIVYSGHNEFLESRTYNKLLKVPEFVRSLGVLASHMRLYSVLYDMSYKRDAVLSTEVKPLLDNSVGPEDYHRDDEMRDAILNDYETSLLRMTNIGESAGAKMILVTPASNIRDFSPFKTEPSAGLSDADVKQVHMLKRVAKLAMDEEDYIRAETVAKEALTLDERDADLLYLYARALLALDRIDEARSAFTQARDEDICPLRALTPIGAIVSDIAQIKNTGFIDFDRIVNEHSANGIPGSELFLDHVHPTIEGNKLLALAIVEEMTQEGMVSPGATWNQSLITEISENLINSLDEEDHAVALRNLSKVLAWAGKEDEAERLVNQAVDIIPDDSEAHAQKGSLLMQSGNLEAALVHYREAVRLNPWNARAHHTYGVLLSQLGRSVEAREEIETAIRLDPKLDKVHYDLGIVLQALGKMKEAEAAYRMALKQDPNHAETYNNLGILNAENGNLKTAFENFAKALKLDPNNREAASNLARARKALGR